MRRWRLSLLVVLTAALVGALGLTALANQPATGSRPATTAAATGLSSDVQFFYYPWYGNPTVSGAWRHWQQGGHNPPEDIGSNYYPVSGAYDSADYTGAVAQQMAWIQESGVGVLIYSWWGQGSYEDSLAAGVLAEAARYGIKVAWHIEPYTGRTAASVVSDINYLNSSYGASPAFYRDPTHGDKPAFYVFDSLDITDWSALDAVTGSNIVLAQTTDTSKVAHFNGMYTYDAIAADTAGGWAGVGAYCQTHGMVWAPSVGPGYLDDRAVPGNTTPTLDRDNGATYDQEWTNATTPSIGGNPSWVSITSFNEWHEGSQVEPASSTPPAGYGYLTYQGAYGTTGTASQTAYLDRTRYWVSQFDHTGTTTPPPTTTTTTTAAPPPNTNLALGRPVSASGSTQTYAPANAVDGNSSSYWESTDNAFPQWLQVDLGVTDPVSRIVLDLPPATAWGTRTQTLSVSGSTNGSTFSTVVGPAGYTFNPATGNTVTISVPSTSTRYLRLTFTANTGWPAGQVSELQVFP
ncbi:MAG TPA: discoidin domain-containing protein [Pseudonocardiaceae bacterium]|nr:discoidin domain-containing protein [Pseudonocardiaceae bacterium]